MSEASPPGSFARRIAITIGVPLAYFAIARIPVPGIDASLFAGGSPATLGILALGITPALTAFTLVELAAAIVPRWRPLRHGGGKARQKLEQASIVLMLVLAIAQAYGVARVTDVSELASSAGIGPMLLRSATWVAGACLSLIMARWIGRQGIANGFVLLSLLAIALTASTTPVGPTEIHSGREVAIAIASVVVLAIALIVALRVLAPRDPREVWIPVPASSIAPFYGAVDGLLVLSAIAITNPKYAPSVRALETSGLRPIALSGICAVAAIALALQFHRPSRVRELLTRITGAAPSREAIETAIFRAVAPTILLFICLVFAETTVGRAGRTLAWVPLAMAVLFDVTDAFRVHLRERDLQSVWQERRPYAVPAIVDKLATENIPAWPLQLGQQVVLQIFGPYVPVEIWVRRADRERAQKLLESILLEPKAEPIADETKPSDPIAAPPRRTRLGLLLLAALAVTTIALSVVPRTAPRDRNAQRARLEIVAVDDSIDPFEAIDEAELPHGVSILIEHVGGVGGRSVHYARLVPEPGESPNALIERVRLWSQTIAMAGDARIAWGEVSDRESKALRSYLLRGAPIATQVDIARAAPVVDREGGQVFVGVQLENDAAERFRIFTAEHVGQRVAIVVDDRVMSAPIVRSEIGGGKLSITLGGQSFDSQLDQAERLANALGGP